MALEGASGPLQAMVFVVGVALLAGYLTYQDAQSRPDTSPATWAVVMTVATIVVPLLGALLAFAAYYLLVINE